MTEDFRISREDYFIAQLNVNTAKKICFLLAFSFIIYHSIIHLRFGNDSCKWLLQDLGRFKGDKEWQPFGCMIHKYSTSDTRRCNRLMAFLEKKNHFLFIGDGRVKQLFESFIGHFQQSTDIIDSLKNEYLDEKLELRVSFVAASDLRTMLAELEHLQREDADHPNFIIASSKFQKSPNYTKELEKALTKNLSLLVAPIDYLTTRKQTKVLWKLQDPIDESSSLETAEWKDVTNNDIEHFNQIVSDTLKYSNVNIWRSGNQVAYGLLDEMKEGSQLGPRAIQHDIQIILNIYCNDAMNYNDGTCCSTSENYTVLQIITYSIFLVCLVLMLVLLLRKAVAKFRNQALYMPLQQDIGVAPPSSISTNVQELIVAQGILGIIMVYFYLCDRTNFFMKENKYYSEFSFWIPVCWMGSVGLFFTEDSKFTRVLNRDQTDEMKGFMIIVILIYFITTNDDIGTATRVIPVYMLIKVFISTFLFLTGYQHFSYFWHSGNNGIVRFLNVLFRINFMTIVLCFAMNRPYQFYFFAPLVSFWFTVVYVTFTLPPRITAQTIDMNNSYQYLYLVMKFVCLLGVITVLYMSEVFFERIFLMRPWRALFVVDDFVDEWWYRFKLDRYSTAFGMIFSAIFIAAQKYNIVDDSNHGNLFSRRISLSSILLSIAGLGFYTTFTFFCKNKLDCEEIHSYVVFIPIVSFIFLRNISGVLRTRFSTLFSWFGKISLELFICMHHIWLAADRHGVLVLLPGYPTMNIILTSFIFVCIAHEIHRLTQILVSFAVPNDWKLAIRNLILFIVVLLPIGRSDGMI